MTTTLPPIADTIKALQSVSMLPGTKAKRFVRDMANADPGRLSAAQCNFIYDLAWKFRRQMPQRLVPPSPKNGAPWLAPKPRGPKRIYSVNADATPPWAVWVGPGSKWENPWAGDSHAARVATTAAFWEIFRPSEHGSTGGLKLPRAATKAERHATQVFLFEHWTKGWANVKPRLILIAEEAMNYPLALEAGQLGDPIPAPWTIPQIREELAGKCLALAYKSRRIACHADVLLEIANEGAR